MNKKNKFKAAVVADAVMMGLATHPEAVRQVEENFKVYPALEWGSFEHCGDPECLCGNKSVRRVQPEEYGTRVGKYFYGEGFDGLYSWTPRVAE